MLIDVFAFDDVLFLQSYAFDIFNDSTFKKYVVRIKVIIVSKM